MPHSITPADIHWDEQGLPRSTQFEDVYFSVENGLEETRHVFLQGNQLEQRWHALDDQQNFVICETGFGSGLNLLASAQLWQKVAPSGAQLHFISTELYPLKKDDLKRALSLWPELTDLADQLIAQYPALTPGYHQLELNIDRKNNKDKSIAKPIKVNLIFDDVVDGLKSLCPTLAIEQWGYQNWNVDAWFLDGFAPAKNPKLWQTDVFNCLNRLSAQNATVATFTCAGVAKRGLKDGGFEIEKIPGFGRKREMLVARKVVNNLDKPRANHKTINRTVNTQRDLQGVRSSFRQTSPTWHLDEQQSTKPRSVAIIGAGIAGCSMAEALSRRGIHSTIFDKSSIANAASGFPQAALYARLSPDQGDLEDFCLHALNYSRTFYQKHAEQIDHKTAIQLCGLIQLPKTEQERQKMQRIAERFCDAPELVSYQNSRQLSSLSGTTLDSAGLFFPHSGWIEGPTFCQYLLKQSQALVYENTVIKDIVERDDLIDLIGKNKETLGTFDAVVICTATEPPPIKEIDWLPIRPIRGQISFLPSQSELENIQTVICKKTSLTPLNAQGRCSVGATYEIDQNHAEISDQDHLTNLIQLQDTLGLKQPLDIDPTNIKGRASIRATTPDYLPLVGSLAKTEQFLQRFQLWRKDRKRSIPMLTPNHKGIYLNIGFGSRGYTYAPFCTEILAARIAKEPELASIKMQRSLHPARFLVRSLARNKPLKTRNQPHK